jgi:hypothetical protein
MALAGKQAESRASFQKAVLGDAALKQISRALDDSKPLEKPEPDVVTSLWNLQSIPAPGTAYAPFI